MRTPEGAEKDDIRKYLDKIGVWHFVKVATPMGVQGIPDIVGCIPIVITQEMVGRRIGVFMSVEVKREGKEPTPRQELRMDEIAKVGGWALWGTAEKVIREIKVWINEG